METVNFLAQFWGFSLVIISFGFLINPKNRESAISLLEDSKNLTIFGIMNVMLGVAFVLFYNVWDKTWWVLVTLLAWLLIARGIVCLFFPDTVKKGTEMLRNKKDLFPTILVAGVIVGCLLVYLGQTM